MAKGKAVVVKDEMDLTQQAVTGELETTTAAAREQAEVHAAVILARKFPRDEQKSYERILKACQRPSFADDATYSFPRGGTIISGPSVNIAREAARLWGNVRFGLDIIRDDEESRAIRGWAWDVETNTKVSYVDEFQKLIYRKPNPQRNFVGGWVTPDERDLRELTNRRGAICLRNCLLQVIPRDFIEDALAECEKTLKGQTRRDKPAILKSVIASFDGLGVTQTMIEKYLNHPLDQATDAEIVQLRGIYRAITDDYARKEEYFGDGQPKATAEGKLKMEDLKPGKEEEHQGHDVPPKEKAKSNPVQELLDEIASITTNAGINEFQYQINARIKKAGIKDDHSYEQISRAVNKRRQEILQPSKGSEGEK